MYKTKGSLELQIESYIKFLSKKSNVDPYVIFSYRKQLRKLYQNDKAALSYLEKVISEAEVSLQNILNLYPHN